MENMELKAYKLLAELRGKALNKIRFEAANKIQYCEKTPEEFKIWMGYIGDIEKWDYSGILSKEDLKVLETLEYLLNDSINIK